MTPEQKFLLIFGTKTGAAKAFGVTYETIRLWCHEGLPLRRAVEIERKTHGDITAEEILKAHKAAPRKRKAV